MSKRLNNTSEREILENSRNCWLSLVDSLKRNCKSSIANRFVVIRLIARTVSALRPLATN